MTKHTLENVVSKTFIMTCYYYYGIYETWPPSQATYLLV